MILRSAGFVRSDLIRSQNAINFAYILYLQGRVQNVSAADLGRIVPRWFVMSLLTGRYSSNPETAFDFDIRQIASKGVLPFATPVIEAELSEGFWTTLLPQQMETSSASSPYFSVFQAAQIKLNDKGFLSRDISVQDLILHRSDIHHIYPKKHLKNMGVERGSYNQIANFALTQSEINIAIGDRDPKVYFSELVSQVNGAKKSYRGIAIDSLSELKDNMRMNCIPMKMLDENTMDYDEFLTARRKLMAARIQEYFSKL